MMYHASAKLRCQKDKKKLNKDHQNDVNVLIYVTVKHLVFENNKNKIN